MKRENRTWQRPPKKGCARRLKISSASCGSRRVRPLLASGRRRSRGIRRGHALVDFVGCDRPHRDWPSSPAIFRFINARTLIRNQAVEQEQALPRMEVIEVGRSSPKSELELPGNIQAITEAPILARANGYIKRRMVDIGDRVQAGQPMAEIEAPELDQQIRQAKANARAGAGCARTVAGELRAGQVESGVRSRHRASDGTRW